VLKVRNSKQQVPHVIDGFFHNLWIRPRVQNSKQQVPQVFGRFFHNLWI